MSTSNMESSSFDRCGPMSQNYQTIGSKNKSSRVDKHSQYSNSNPYLKKNYETTSTRPDQQKIYRAIDQNNNIINKNNARNHGHDLYSPTRVQQHSVSFNFTDEQTQSRQTSSPQTRTSNNEELHPSRMINNYTNSDLDKSKQMLIQNNSFNKSDRSPTGNISDALDRADVQLEADDVFNRLVQRKSSVMQGLTPLTRPTQLQLSH